MVKLKWQSCCWKREYRPFLQTERVCSPCIWLHRDPWRRGTAEAMKVQYLYVVSQYISSESLEDRSRELRQTLLMRDRQDTGTSCSPLHPLGGPAAVAICPCEVGCHDSRQADSSALCCSLWCVWSHGGWAFAACIHEERQGQRWTICITSAEGGCQEPSGVKMGVYWQYTQWFTLGSLVVFGLLFLLTCKMRSCKRCSLRMSLGFGLRSETHGAAPRCIGLLSMATGRECSATLFWLLISSHNFCSVLQVDGREASAWRPSVGKLCKRHMLNELSATCKWRAGAR